MQPEVFIEVFGRLAARSPVVARHLCHNKQRQRVGVDRICAFDALFVDRRACGTRIPDVAAVAHAIRYACDLPNLRQVISRLVDVDFLTESVVGAVQSAAVICKFRVPVAVEVAKEDGTFICIIFTVLCIAIG